LAPSSVLEKKSNYYARLRDDPNPNNKVRVI
jgi:hypothetical protein